MDTGAGAGVEVGVGAGEGTLEDGATGTMATVAEEDVRVAGTADTETSADPVK